MKLLDLFAGRLGWSRAFLDRGWEVMAYDLNLPDMAIPAGADYRLQDILTLTPEDIREINPDFICASSPCEQFSVHGMKHFHPNPKYPEMGLTLFTHTRMLCESSGVPYVMENVRSAQKFVGDAAHHCGPFYLWGSGVPPLMNQGISKGISLAIKGIENMSQEQKKEARRKISWQVDASKSKRRKIVTAFAATIPPELASCVADYAERITEKESVA